MCVKPGLWTDIIGFGRKAYDNEHKPGLTDINQV